MKKVINLFIKLSIFLCCISLNAQRYPVQVTQTVLPPFSTKLSDYTTATNVKFRLNILLTDVVLNNRQVRLKLRIRGNGLDIRSREVVSGAPQIILNGGVLQQFTNLELGAFFQLNNLSGISPQDYNKPLPEGVYSICWEVIDVITNQQINNPSAGCSDVFLILNDPPFLNLPFKGDQLVAKDPMNIIFQWTPRHVNATNVSYDFELREIWDRNIDPQAAFLASPNYYTETLRNTTLLYDISKPVLLPKKLYGWRVKAKSLTGITENSVFKNDGFSEIFYFTYTNKCDAPSFILSEALNSKGVKITWQGSFDHKKFHLQYKREDIPDAEWFDVYTFNNQAQISNLKEGKTYLFRVGGSCNELNDPQQAFSYSTISQFTMPSKEEEATYNCGIIPEIDIQNLEPLKNIGINETFTAGDFPVTVKQIRGGNGVYSGKGFIVVPYLADTKIAVTFSSIKINEDYQLVEGVIKTTYDPTWGGVSDVNDAFNGGEGASGSTTVDFVIQDVQVDPNGDIIVIGTNGEIVELPGGEDQLITGSDGQTWSVDEEGNVTQSGEVAEGGATNTENTNGVNNQGEATAITAKGVVVTFKQASEALYGFDAHEKKSDGTKDLYKKLNDDYFIPYKAVANGQTEKIIAELNISDTSIKPQDIIFKTKDGIAIQKIDSTATSYTLELKGIYTDADVESQALIKQGDKYEVAGAFIQYQAKIKEVDVVLVNASDSNTQKIKEKLQNIYQSALVKLNIKEINDFTDVIANVVPDDVIDSGESGFAAQYTEQQRAINKELKRRNDFNQSAYYLILTSKKPSTKEEKGLMPLGRQFGYIYMNNGADERTVAHELGHGAFQLKHPFSIKSYGYNEQETNWLLDYGKGEKIPYVHWKEIHNPKLRLGIFDKDNDGQSVSTTMPIALSINEKKHNDKYYYGYLTPSGERIILSQEYRPIFFHGISNDTYNNVVAGTLIGFKKKFKDAQGQTQEKKYSATIINDEFLGYSDFEYKKPDIKDDYSFVVGLPYGTPDFDNGHWKNYKFKNKKITEYTGQDKPILSILSDDLQNLGLFNDLKSVKAIKYVNPTKILGEGQIKVTDREIKLLSGYYNSDEQQWFKDLLSNSGRESYTIAHNERREVFLIIKIAEIYNRYPEIFREFTKFFNNWDLLGFETKISFNPGKWDKENIPLDSIPSEKYNTWKKYLRLTESNDELYDFYQQFLIELFEFVKKEAEANIACLSEDFENKNKHELYECILRASEFELRDLPVKKQLIAIKKILSTSNSGGEIPDEKEIQIARLLQAISKNKNSYTETLKYLENEQVNYTWSVQTNNAVHTKKDSLPVWRALFENVEDKIFVVGEDNRQSIVRSIGQIFLGSKEYFVKQLQENINPELLTSMTFKDLKSLHDSFFTYENDYQNIFRRGWSDIEATAQGVGGITIYDEEDLYKSVDTKITDQDLINVRQKVKWGLFNSTTLKNEDLTPFQLVSFINISKNNLLKSFTAKDEQGNPQALFIPAFTLHYASETDRLTTKSDIIITTIDLLAFLPSGGVASLNTFGKFVYYADKVSSVSSMVGTAFKETDPTLTEFSNHLSLVSGIASLGGLSKKMTRLSTQEKLVDVIKSDVVLRDVIHKDVLKSTNNQVENVNNFAERILNKEFDLSAITKEQIDVTKEILENEIKYLRDFPGFKAAKVREAIAKVDQLGLEKLNITYKSVVDANLVSKEKIANALIELNKINNDGFIDIVVHGSKNKFVLDLPNGINELEASNLVDYIKNDKAYKNVKNFRLLTCANIDLAKDFARLLPEGYTVRAVDDIVRIHSDGGVTTVPRESNKPVGEWKDFTKQKDGTVKQKSAQSPKAPTSEHLSNFVQLGGNIDSKLEALLKQGTFKNIYDNLVSNPSLRKLEKYGLTIQEEASFVYYKDSFNGYIYDFSIGKQVDEEWRLFLEPLLESLGTGYSKLPKNTNTIYRGLQREEASKILALNVGERFDFEGAYKSFSTEYGVAEDFRQIHRSNVILELKSKTGASLMDINPDEFEVLTDRNVLYEVVDKKLSTETNIWTVKIKEVDGGVSSVNPNFVQIDDVTTKVNNVSQHITRVVHNPGQFRKVNKTFNNKEYELEGFIGVHTEKSLKDYIEKYGGDYAIENRKGDANGVYQGVPILYSEGKEYVKVTGKLMYHKGVGKGQKVGGLSTFFPDTMSDDEILENAIHAIQNNHGPVPDHNVPNSQLLYGFSKDGKIEIRFKLNSDGKIGTFYPVPKELNKLPRIRSFATTSDVQNKIKKILEDNSGIFPKNLDLLDFNLGTNNDDIIDIIIHSNAKGEFIMNVEGQEKTLSALALARVLDQVPANQKVRILSCNSHEAALEISKLTDVPFYASHGVVKLYPDGVIVHDTPFQRYHRGARSDLGEIPPNTTPGKGTPIELGKLDGSSDSDAIIKVFGENSNGVKEKVKELEFNQKTLEDFIDDFSNLSKELLKEISENPELIEAWKSIYDIHKGEPFVLTIPDLKEVYKILSAVGGYKKWKLTPRGKENKLWERIEMVDESFDVVYVGGEKEVFGDYEISKIGELGLDIKLASYLQRQGITSEVFRLVIQKHEPKEFKAVWIETNYYEGGKSTNLQEYLNNLHLGREKAAFETPSGKLAKRNGFTGEPIFIVDRTDEVQIVFTKPEYLLRTETRKIFTGLKVNVYKEINVIISKVESLEPKIGEALIKDLKSAPENTINAIVKDPDLIDSWVLMNQFNGSQKMDANFLKFLKGEEALHSWSEVIKRRVKLKEKYPSLSLEELTAVYHYSRSYGYESLNKALRGIEPMTDELEVFDNVLKKTLNKFPKYSQTTYRGARVEKSLLDKYKKAYKNKTPHEEKGYMSTSKDDFTAENFSTNQTSEGKVRVIFTVKSKNGFDIENASGHGPTFSYTMNEREVLYQNGQKFKVTKFRTTIDKNLKKLVYITLEDL
ncbi:ADP-ribosyltransferase [Tenacibaculum jejuense]|uniref:Fibronectin type-III domain-containing protein n=1 Tax=Tenacibaculum jejuense TaxID=584609 RepID=A0A238U5Z0_9FLAO|nr:ADP-ribosyltransferase [Tenacibaculum jejuense]SNR14557.1 Protein of unknown function precursor [Tenacibaculum jejuense]